MTDPLTPVVLEQYRAVLDRPDQPVTIAALARTLASSGVVRPTKAGSADLASTGGPSSLSTLLCPLFLTCRGMTVPKIGVPGRPAGGIDVLGTIDGYRYHLTPTCFERALGHARFAHALADETWAPADAALFRFRQRNGTQAVPSLAIASLLAKKIAAGVRTAGLEARIGSHGNFGRDATEAKRHAGLYCDVARELDLSPIVILTNGATPYQPYIGRGEALTALLDICTGNADPWLSEHVNLCSAMADAVASACTGADVVVSDGSLITSLKAHLDAQGSSWESMSSRVDEVALQPRYVLRADTPGYVHYDLGRIRTMLTSDTGRRESSTRDANGSRFVDHAGARLLCHPTRAVQRGEDVIEIRGDIAESLAMSSQLFTILDVPSAAPNQIAEIVT